MSDFVRNDIATRFGKKMSERVAATRSGRFDLKLYDYKVTTPYEARILVAYSNNLGTPKRSEIDEWATTSFNGNAVVDLKTLRNYPDHNVITAFVRKVRRMRPLSDHTKMITTGNARYMDDDKTIWEVMTRDGQRYLARAEKDDLEEILRIRQTQERTASIHHRIRLRDLVTAGIHDLEPGDHVRFSYDGILQQGEVSKVGKENVTIKANGKSLTVDTMSVVDVVEKSPKAKAEQDKFLREFFEKAYGDKAFADELVDVGE